MEHFVVEDLLDFSHDDGVDNDHAAFDDHLNGGGSSNSTDSSSGVTPVDSCNSSFSGGHNDVNFVNPNNDIGCHFSGDLGVPYDDLAELEWLSNFVEESFSSEDVHHKFHLISGMPPSSLKQSRTDDQSSETRPDLSPMSPALSPGEMPTVPGKARSKRSRAAPGSWASRLLMLTPSEAQQALPKAAAAPKKKAASPEPNGEVRRCLHCATDKTPQWRTGPMGPKTLCNACGVRYKSGRLVPEYRPAASPTFMLTKHSNSHRKVMELRRQKELMRQQHVHQQHYQQQMLSSGNSSSMTMFDPSNGDDYLIHQHIGPDYRQLI